MLFQAALWIGAVAVVAFSILGLVYQAGKNRQPSAEDEWNRRFRERVEQQRAAAPPSDALIQHVLEVHYRQMLADPAARRQVKAWIEAVERPRNERMYYSNGR